MICSASQPQRAPRFKSSSASARTAFNSRAIRVRACCSASSRKIVRCCSSVKALCSISSACLRSSLVCHAVCSVGHKMEVAAPPANTQHRWLASSVLQVEHDSLKPPSQCSRKGTLFVSTTVPPRDRDLLRTRFRYEARSLGSPSGSSHTDCLSGLRGAAKCPTTSRREYPFAVHATACPAS
jgi:hypothetical protein